MCSGTRQIRVGVTNIFTTGLPVKHRPYGGTPPEAIVGALITHRVASAAHRLVCDALCRHPIGLATFGFPEDRGDLVNFGQEILASRRIHRLFGVARSFDGVPKQFVQLRVSLDMDWLDLFGQQQAKEMCHHYTSQIFKVDAASAI